MSRSCQAMGLPWRGWGRLQGRALGPKALMTAQQARSRSSSSGLGLSSLAPSSSNSRIAFACDHHRLHVAFRTGSLLESHVGSREQNDKQLMH